MNFCMWTEDEEGAWDTECGDKHIINSGTPYSNGFKFCLYCGRQTLQLRYLEPPTNAEIESLKAQLANIRQENVLYSADAQRIRWLVKPEEHEELFEAVDRALAECRDKALEEAAEIAGNHFIYGHSVAGPAFAARCAENIRSLKGENP